MRLKTVQKGNIVVIGFPRDSSLHFGNVDDFKSQVLRYIQKNTCLVLDCTNLEFIDSAGITALIHLHKKIASHNGQMKLAQINDSIQRILEITRLHRVFEVYDTLEQAIRSARRQTPSSQGIKSEALKIRLKKTEKYTYVQIVHPETLVAPYIAPLKRKLDELIQETPVLILNLNQVRSIDSHGIAMFIHLKALAKKSGKKILLVYNNRVLTRLFKLYSLDDLFPQFERDSEAFLAIRSKGPDTERAATQSTKRAVQIAEEKPAAPPQRKSDAVLPRNFDEEYSDLSFLEGWKNAMAQS